MNEKEWVESICKKLNEQFVHNINKLHAQTAVKLPYAREIESFDENWHPKYKKEDLYETDLLIYDENEKKRIPRIVVEAKFQKVTTHDAIIYSEKATEHKTLMPFLRYGIMIGAMEEAELPWRLVSHGNGFDFMFVFKNKEPSDEEWKTFCNLIMSEVENSESIEKLRKTKGKGTGFQYLQRNLSFK